MHSMKQEDTLVVGGVDAHADSHQAAALDHCGALLGTESFPTTTPGYGRLLDWLCAFGEVEVVAIESTGSHAAALVRYLRERGVRVVEVNQPHAHTRRRRGKSDPIDAELAARLALAGKATAVPKQTDGIVESIRLLRAARQSAVKSRSAAMGPARRTDRHRPAGVARSALLPQDDSRQGGALPPAEALDRRAPPADSRRKVRAALHRRTHRHARR
jgi:transposase